MWDVVPDRFEFGTRDLEHMMGSGDFMKRTGTGRVLATLFLGVMVGIYIHFSELRTIGRGRELYLAAQNHRFDRLVQHHSGVPMAVAGIILATVAVGLYELIAAGITNVLPPSSAEE